ncbi:unnamed protein product [Urochloa decumbens]|uniref:F-box domain-containing protein n=1 Tax=Urochloa decumbens TaxID=240449 RepID=A0ABC9B3V4_9POAL
MDPEPSGVLAADRLSRLGDAVLGHILSFLPAVEAARASGLSRRWRHVFAAVHTLTFREEAKPRDPYSDDYGDSGWSRNSDDSGRHQARTVALPFADAVSAALHARHGRPHSTVSLRGLRIEFGGSERAASAVALDWWLQYVARQAAAIGELHVDLRLGQGPICARGYSLRRRSPSPPRRRHPLAPPPACDSPSSPYAPPRSLLHCAALRSLRLESCRLDTPGAAALPSLGTLHLTRVADVRRAGGSAIQRLVSACPRLADLTLEACGDLTKLSILSPCLRRLALNCCHELAAVVIAADSPELQRFEYSGPMPGPWFQAAHRPRRISSCMVNFCGDEAMDPTNLARLREFLLPFAGAANLRIKSARLGAGVGHGVLSSAPELPCFHALRHLELTGMLTEDDVTTIAGVAKMLEGTPILETMSLLFMPSPEEGHLRAAHKLSYNPYAKLAVPEGAGIACLRETTREINLVYYQGETAQRMLAKFLLGNARVVGEVYCEFASGPLFTQTKLMEEITGWVLNKSANMVFY